MNPYIPMTCDLLQYCTLPMLLQNLRHYCMMRSDMPRSPAGSPAILQDLLQCCYAELCGNDAETRQLVAKITGFLLATASSLCGTMREARGGINSTIVSPLLLQRPYVAESCCSKEATLSMEFFLAMRNACAANCRQ